MWRLYHSSICPFGRAVRLVLNEKRVAYEPVEGTPPHDSGASALRDARLPQLHNPALGVWLVGSRAICEYLEETVPSPPLISGGALERAEIRRLVADFDELFFAAVTAVLIRMPPNSQSASVDLSKQAQVADVFLDDMDYLLERRRWLAADVLSLADFVAAAHISVADYFGALNWTGHDQTAVWYSVMKSRRSFTPLLRDCIAHVPAAPHYANIDA